MIACIWKGTTPESQTQPLPSQTAGKAGPPLIRVAPPDLGIPRRRKAHHWPAQLARRPYSG